MTAVFNPHEQQAVVPSSLPSNGDPSSSESFYRCADQSSSWSRSAFHGKKQSDQYDLMICFRLLPCSHREAPRASGLKSCLELALHTSGERCSAHVGRHGWGGAREAESAETRRAATRFTSSWWAPGSKGLHKIA